MNVFVALQEGNTWVYQADTPDDILAVSAIVFKYIEECRPFDIIDDNKKFIREQYQRAVAVETLVDARLNAISKMKREIVGMVGRYPRLFDIGTGFAEIQDPQKL